MKGTGQQKFLIWQRHIREFLSGEAGIFCFGFFFVHYP